MNVQFVFNLLSHVQYREVSCLGLEDVFMRQKYMRCHVMYDKQQIHDRKRQVWSGRGRQRGGKGDTVSVYVLHISTTFECVCFKSHWMINQKSSFLPLA